MPTVAEQLRQAREAMKLDVHEVAEATKLKTDQIRALEDANYDYFTAPVYLRGSLRTYANLLKLDAVQLVTQLEVERGAAQRAPVSGESAAVRRGALDSVMLRLSRVNWLIAGALVFVLVVGLVARTSYRAWKARRSVDPLSNLSSVMYQPPAQAGDLLPLPTNIARKAP